MALSLASVILAAVAGATVITPLIGLDVVEVGQEVTSAIKETTKRCVLPDDHVDLVGGRFNSDGNDILNSCEPASERWGVRTQYDTGGRFGSAQDIFRWCSQEGQFNPEYQEYRYPDAACEWSFARQASWIDWEST